MNQILLGDCRDVLPTLPRARLLLTDPPYNIGFGEYASYKDSMSDEEYIAMLKGLRDRADIVVVIQYPEETAKYVTPALGVPDEVLAWCYNSNLPRQFRLVSIFGGKPDFNKVLQPYKDPADRRIAGLIDDGSEGTRLYDWFSDIQLVKNISTEKTIHPCPIPEKLAERIIILLTQPGDLVLDPFCGCGTVPIAAKVTGRDYIGIEMDPIYHAEAVRRVNHRMYQEDL